MGQYILDLCWNNIIFAYYYMLFVLFCKVVKVRLPEDNGRFRGFGYVEFENRQGLIDALALNDEVRITGLDNQNISA